MESRPRPSPNSGATGSTCSGGESRLTTSAINRAISISKARGSTAALLPGRTLAIRCSAPAPAALEGGDLDANGLVQILHPAVVVAVDRLVLRDVTQVGAVPVGDVVGLGVVGNVDD